MPLTVSGVVPVRNDGHGADLPLRAAIALRAQAAAFDEVVVVDMNTAAGRPPLLDTLDLPAWVRARVKSVVVTGEQCDKLAGHACGAIFLESLARSVGVAAAASDVVASLAIDSLPPPRRTLRQLALAQVGGAR